MAFELNPQQSAAVKGGYSWYKSQTKQTYQVSGPAGSGKTTIVSELASLINLKREEVLYMALVGKATMALALKGNFAKTIHSTIYDRVEFPKLDDNGKIITQNGRPVTIPRFVKKEKLPDGVKLLVVDEGGMLDKTIAADILSFGLPVIVLGDLDQLPPVFGASYFLRNPDVILTEIMRQAEGDPIIYLSQRARQGKKLELGKYGEKCYVVPQADLHDQLLETADTIICGKNETRQNINDYYRQNIMGVKDNIPVFGDKVVCRKNNWNLALDGHDDIFLINGMIGFVEDIYLETYNGKSICIDFRPEFTDRVFSKIRIDFEYLFKPMTDNSGNGMFFLNKFQFGRAITCHLAQGSQYPNVLVYRERVGGKDYQRRWDYTAVTRAESGLVVAI